MRKLSRVSEKMGQLIDKVRANYTFNGETPKIIYNMITEANGYMGCILEVDRKWLDDASVVMIQQSEYALAELRRMLKSNGWIDRNDNSPRTLYYEYRVRYRFECPEEICEEYKNKKE